MIDTKSAGSLPADAVILLWVPISDSEVSGSREPFMLKIRPPYDALPVAFGSRALAAKLVSMLEMGGRRRFTLEPAGEVMAAFPPFFVSRELVYFPDKSTIDRFVNESGFLPLRSI